MTNALILQASKTSPTMGEAEVLRYLGVTKKELVSLLSDGRLGRHPHLRIYARDEVETLAYRLRKEISYDDATALERERPSVVGEPRLRSKPKMD